MGLHCSCSVTSFATSVSRADRLLKTISSFHNIGQRWGGGNFPGRRFLFLDDKLKEIEQTKKKLGGFFSLFSSVSLRSLDLGRVQLFEASLSRSPRAQFLLQKLKAAVCWTVGTDHWVNISLLYCVSSRLETSSDHCDCFSLKLFWSYVWLSPSSVW